VTKRDVGIALTTFAVMGGLFGMAYIGSLPPTVLTPTPGEGITRLPAALLTQGWAFFTREGREETIAPWSEGTNGAWQVISASRSTTPDHAFGLKRGSRSLVGDLDALTAESLNWETCDTSIDLCLRGQAKSASQTPAVSLNVTGSHICGRVGLVRSKPVPFAYAPVTDRREAKTAVLLVDCSRP